MLLFHQIGENSISSYLRNIAHNVSQLHQRMLENIRKCFPTVPLCGLLERNLKAQSGWRFLRYSRQVRIALAGIADIPISPVPIILLLLDKKFLLFGTTKVPRLNLES